MAGDWIPMRLDLAEDPAVLEMVELTGLDEFGVVGRLHALWSWVSRQCNGDVTLGALPHALARVTRVELQFIDALQEVGWLEVLEVDGRPAIRIPNYDRWLSQGAKTRQLTSRRVAKHRAESCNAASVTKSLPEKRREEKRRKKKPPTPFRPEDVETLLAVDSRFRPVWSDFCQHRKEIKHPLTPQATKGALARLEEMGIDRALAALKHTIANGWQGIREPDQNGRSQREMTLEELDAASEALRK